MRPFGAAQLLAVQSHVEGELGAALYVSPPDAASPTEIVFDRFRPLGAGPFVVVDPTYEPGEYLLSDASVALVKSPTTDIAWTLPAEYLGATFWVQVRPHEGGLELDTIYRPRPVRADDSGKLIEIVGGTAVITRVEQLDGGGARLWWDWYPAIGASQPAEFVWSGFAAGATTPAPVITPLEFGGVRYVADVLGMDDGATYTLTLVGRAGVIELTLGTLSFVPDATGPAGDVTLSAREET